LEGACNSAHQQKGWFFKKKITLYNLTGKNPIAAPGKGERRVNV